MPRHFSIKKCVKIDHPNIEKDKTMKTVLKGSKKEVIINTEGPVVIIGEKINPTGHKKLAAALQEANFDYVRELAERQVAAGADLLDINDVAMMPKIVKLVAELVDVPICLDSPNPAALEAGLAVAPGKPLVNSVSGEEARLKEVLPLVKERGAAVIGLTMDDNGIPTDPEGRVAIAEKILERAAKIGIPAEDVVIDPLVMTVGADSQAGRITLKTIELVRAHLGTNINLGASNVSFGLPDRLTINQAYLALTIGAGATCVISDPMKLCGIIRASDLLLGRDEYAMRYIKYFRSLPKEPV
jgi:5-methyltetrahydrofolate--homocysteine methyltransferase